MAFCKVVSVHTASEHSSLSDSKWLDDYPVLPTANLADSEKGKGKEKDN